MKNLLRICLLAIVSQQSINLNAQVVSFQIDNQLHFVMENYSPNSELTFYSAFDGGQILKFAKVDKEGKLSFAEDLNFKPKRVYNPVVPDKNAAPGSGKIETLEQKEFVLNKLTLSAKDGMNEVSWEAGNTANDEIEYKVFKSTDNRPFQLLTTFRSSPQSLKEKFSVNDASRNSIYKVEVWNTSKGKLRYKSSPLAIDKIALIYPTVVREQITVELLSQNSYGQYFLINTLGQKVATGSLASGSNGIELSELAIGTYSLYVESGGRQQVTKIVKAE
jgi:hypothetical protein